MHVENKTTKIEYLEKGFPYTSKIFIKPNKTNANEKNTLIALTAIINSVASGLIYEYQFQFFGTKKCQIPNPIEILLPIDINNFTIKLYNLTPINCK